MSQRGLLSRDAVGASVAFPVVAGLGIFQENPLWTRCCRNFALYYFSGFLAVESCTGIRRDAWNSCFARTSNFPRQRGGMGETVWFWWEMRHDCEDRTQKGVFPSKNWG